MNCNDGNWVVEVLVLIEPLVAEVALSTDLEGGVDWSEVLDAAHGGDPFVRGIVDWLVVLVDSDWEPSLSDLWVDVGSDAVVSIDLLKNGKVDAVDVGFEGVVEDNLQVGVEIIVSGVVVWGGGTVETDVIEGKLGGFVGLAGVEVEVTLWGGSDAEHPKFPVDGGKNLVAPHSVESRFVRDEVFPSCSKIDSLNASKGVCLDVVLEECLHDVSADERLHVGKELESLLIWDFTERVVWVVSFEHWVKTRVGVLVSK